MKKENFMPWFTVLMPFAAFVIGMLVVLNTLGFIGRTPKVGDVYVIRSNPNPWSEQAKYVVIDAKDGYVLWKHQHGEPIPCKFTVVRFMYKFVGTTTNIPVVKYEE